MIAEMVITVTYADIKSHPTVKLLQVSFHVGAILKNKIYNVQITMPCNSIISIRKSQ